MNYPVIKSQWLKVSDKLSRDKMTRDEMSVQPLEHVWQTHERNPALGIPPTHCFDT